MSTRMRRRATQATTQGMTQGTMHITVLSRVYSLLDCYTCVAACPLACTTLHQRGPSSSCLPFPSLQLTHTSPQCSPLHAPHRPPLTLDRARVLLSASPPHWRRLSSPHESACKPAPPLRISARPLVSGPGVSDVWRRCGC